LDLKECKINEYITVKLHEDAPAVYIRNRQYKIQNFKYLDVSIDEVKSSYNLDSIDGATDKIDEKEKKGNTPLHWAAFGGHKEVVELLLSRADKIDEKDKEERRKYVSRPFIPEYWYEKLCDNLKIWAKNDYDTKLIYGPYAFQLLRKLEIASDPIAIKVLKLEIIKRLTGDNLSIVDFLLSENYTRIYLNSDDLGQIYLNKNSGLLNTLISSKNIRFVSSILEKLDEIGDPDAKEQLKKEKYKRLKSGNPSAFWFLVNNGYLKNIGKDEINRMFEDFNYRTILNADIEEVVSLLSELNNRGVTRANKHLKNYALAKLKDIEKAEDMINWLIWEDRMNLFSKEELKSLDLKDLTIRIGGGGSSNFRVPNEISYIISLEKLSVSSEYDFESLPESIGNLINLKELDLSYNTQLEGLPNSVIKLKNLRSLSLSLETMLEVPEIVSQLTWLEELHLDFEFVAKKVPLLLKGLKNLKILSFEGTEGVAFPNWLGELIWLEELKLNNNNLSNIPDWVKNLKNLKILIMYENEIQTIPEWIGSLNKLKKLSLNLNRITNLPPSICNLKKLEILDLDFNEIEELPESIGEMICLKKLNLGYNQLVTLPNSLGNLINLRELDLRKNKLVILPVSISNLKNLIMFNLEENQLGEIKSLKSKDVRHYLLGAIKESNIEKIVNLINNRLLKFLNVNDFRDIWDKFNKKLVKLFKDAIKILREDYRKFAFPDDYTKFLKQIVSELLKKCGKKEIEILIWLKLYQYLEEEDFSGLPEDLLIKITKNYYYIALHSELYEDPWDLIYEFRKKVGKRISQPIKKLIRAFIITGNYNEIINIRVNRWLAQLTKKDLFELLEDQQLGLLKHIFESIRQKGYEYHGFGSQVDEDIFNYFQKALPPPEAKAIKDIQDLMSEQLIFDHGYHDEMFHAYKVKNNHVVRLWLGYSNISYLPESIGNLHFLKELDLTHCNLSALPEAIGNLKNLIELELFDNRLRSLPESISNLNSLKHLYTGRNPSLIPSLIMNPYNFPSNVVPSDDLKFISNTALLKIAKYKTPGSEKTWRKKFRVILEKNKLGNYADGIMNAIKCRIIIDKFYVGNESPRNVGFSKLGGNPDVPSEFEWPYWKERPLSFLMQLNLEDLKDFEYSQFYSQRGFLYFFFDPLQEEWGINYPKNREAWRIIYHDVDRSALLRTQNPSSDKKHTYPTCYISFFPDIHLPSQAIQLFYFMKGDKFTWHELDDFDIFYSKIRSKILNYNNVVDNHALFGYADMIQEGPFFTESIHLLQLGDDKQLKWRWGGGGRLHFYIKEDNLKKNHFDDVEMVLDCF